MPKVLITLNDGQYEALQSISKETGIPVAELMRRAANDYLQKRYSVTIDPAVKRGGWRERRTGNR